VDERLEKNYWETTNNLGEIKRHVTHPVVKFFSTQRIEYMKKFMNFNSVKSALDVGCGTGFSSFYFPSTVKVTGLDFAFRNLIINPLKNKVQASVYETPFKSNSFDLVFGWDFLHHLEYPEKSIMEMVRITRKYLVLFEPNRNNPIQFIYGLTNKNERGTLHIGKKNLLQILKNLNLKIIHSDSVGWIFAGASPIFSLRLIRYLPFSHRLGISYTIICKKN